MIIGVIVGVRVAVPMAGRVRVGVGVWRTQAPASVQAESNCGVQPVGQAASLGTLQVLPSQMQQSLGPSVGVGVGVWTTQAPLSVQAESNCGVQPIGQAASVGTLQVLPSQTQQSLAPRVGVGVGVWTTQAPLSVQAESRCGVQPTGQAESLGTLQVLPSQTQQSLAPRVGVGVGVWTTQAPVSVQAESRCGVQPTGQAESLGTLQVLPSQTQQSFGPRVGVRVIVADGVAVRVGVLVTQAPATVQAESAWAVQPTGQAESVGTLQVLPSQTQQSLAPRVGVRVGVTVLATQPKSATQAESKTGLQPDGQAELLGTEHSTPAHWQQSLAPRVGVGVGVGVLATQAPASLQAESNCGVQPLGQAELVGTLQVLPAQAQQSLAPRVGVRVGVGVFLTQAPASVQAESNCGVQPSGQAELLGTAQELPSQTQQSFAPSVGVGVTVGVFGTQPEAETQAELKATSQPLGQAPLDGN